MIPFSLYKGIARIILKLWLFTFLENNSYYHWLHIIMNSICLFYTSFLGYEVQTKAKNIVFHNFYGMTMKVSWHKEIVPVFGAQNTKLHCMYCPQTALGWITNEIMWGGGGGGGWKKNNVSQLY